MAKLKMMRVELAADLSESKDIIDLLQRRGAVEVSDCEEFAEFEKLPTASTVAQLEKYLAVARSAYAVLDKFAPQKRSLLASFGERRSLSIAEYAARADEADGILGVCFDINSLNRAIEDAKVASTRLKAAMAALEPWTALDLPTSFKGTRETAAFIGSLPGSWDREELLGALARAVPQTQAVEADVFHTSQSMSCAAVLCSRDAEREVEAALRDMGFVRPSDPTKHPPAVRMKRLEKELADTLDRAEKAKEKLSKMGEHAEKLEFVIDYFSLRIDKYAVMNKLVMSDRVFILNGYIPEKSGEKLKRELEEKFTAAVVLSEPSVDEDCPVLLENNSFAAGVESVTEMYSQPGRGDIDPNPVMSFFYYAFFGLMLSDAGYGLLMVLVAVIAKTRFKLEAKMKKTVGFVLYCGISTVIWGALFGSWFGDIIQVVASSFFGREIGSLALWFEPVNDPMRMMLYSFLFGIIHLFVGLGVRLCMLWREGKKFDAICDVIPVYLLIIGIAPIGAGVVVDVPASLTGVGKYLALAGAALVVLTSGRSSKNILGKLGGGLFGLYNVGSGYLSDILSYSRLLALGLSTGVIASVVNLLGTIPQNPIVKAVLLVVVFIFGHTVNIAINLIGTYVHTNRLHYVEFFSKFYEGGGRSFSPLKVNTKYFKFKEETNNV